MICIEADGVTVARECDQCHDTRHKVVAGRQNGVDSICEGFAVFVARNMKIRAGVAGAAEADDDDSERFVGW